MPWTRFLKMSALDRRVFLVAVASLVPVAILSCVLLFSTAREQRDRLLRASEDTMSALVSAVDAELQSTVAALDAFAASPRLTRGDFVALREESIELLGRRKSWLNIVVADRERHLVNARLPEGSELPRTIATHLVDEVFDTGRPMVGEVLFAPVIETYAVVVMIPYQRQGRARYVIAAVVRPDHFLGLLDSLDKRNTALQGVIAIFDRKNHVVARSLHHEDTVGRPASETLKRVLQSGSRGGRAETRTLEDVPVYTVYRRSALSDWTAAAGIPMESVNGPLVRSYFVLGGAIALSVLLGLVVATFVGRTIVNPMGELEQSAARVGRGEAPGMPRTSLTEVRRVAEALGRAHDERNASFQREREARLAAEQASKAKDEFLAMLGHELRNPLAAITNASLLLERQRQSLDASTSMAVGIIARQSRHLGRLTDDLLDAGRVILGKISLNRAALDLAASVSTTLDSLRSTGRLGDHEFVVLLEPAWVFADATRIDQIIGNLITNAVKYTPAGGRINISTMREGGRASFVITDSGIGLEADLLPRAFDLFVQGERTLDRSQGGLGIGLTLVRRLTELHGGTVKAESPGPGQGATFTVTLPAIDRPGRGASATDETPAESRRHVALIEDNDDARQSLRMLLEVEGHTVHEAADGTAGVALLEGERRISIAFVDIGLPGMDGFETARVLRRKLGSSVRIVALSGYGAEQDVAQGLQAGFDAYVVKPADIQSLRAQIALA